MAEVIGVTGGPEALAVPPPELRFMGEDEELFRHIGDRTLADLRLLAGLRADDHLVDIGSGYGRLAHALLRWGVFRGRYLGMDILPRHVAWCTEHLGDGDRVRFVHLDVHNDRYNPSGTLGIGDLDPPATDADVVVLASVLTHLWPDDVVAELELAARCLGRGGRLYATAFLIDDSWRRLREAGVAETFPVPHVHDANTRYMDPEDPLHVIAYERDWLVARAADAGLVPVTVEYGSWSGRNGRMAKQDVVVFRRRRRLWPGR